MTDYHDFIYPKGYNHSGTNIKPNPLCDLRGELGYREPPTSTNTLNVKITWPPVPGM